MATKQQLYYKLIHLRKKIKETEREVQGRVPIICSDNALYRMAELLPKKLSDFEGISGIGKAFIDNYGERFLSVILEHLETPAEKTVNITSSAAEILKELEKKLVSINRRNRLLYMPKIANKYAFDLFEVCENCLGEIIFGNGSPVTICDMNDLFCDSLLDSGKYKKIVQLLREVSKDLREKGQNNLYIGYPFVKGRLPGEDFDVRAPLVLFPVRADRTSTSIQLALDESRDVVYNTTLILAHFKFNNITRPLPVDVMENYSESTFIDSVLVYYSDNDIRITNQQQGFCSFEEYKANEFPHYNSGELSLEHCAVLGKFPICDSSIQRDFEAILNKNGINSLLNNLLLNADEIDYYSDSYTGEGQIKTNDKQLKISERRLVYINDLNSSQEEVLSAIESVDELVVQGPPGTGKSQTITSLIAEFVSNGKTVLMVSEKKTALDVVYSRLGRLSQYALVIDDVGNKDAFYKQLSMMVLLGQQTGNRNIELSEISDEIDSLVSRLGTIADVLYAPSSFGIEPYKLYLKNQRLDLSDSVQRTKARNIGLRRDKSLLDLTYDQLERIYKLFSDSQTLENLERFISICQTYPWIESVRGSISEYDLFEFEAKLTALDEAIREENGKGFFARIFSMFSKNKVKEQLNSICEDYFSSSKNDIKNLLQKNTETVSAGLKDYIAYQELKPLYERLNKNEITYFNSLLAIKKDCGNTLDKVNFDLFNELLYEHIVQFEAHNRILFQDIDGFDKIIRSLSQAIEKKQELTRQQLEIVLTKGMFNMTNSKRHGEILRAIDSKRKWSVNKFIKKFEFELFRSMKIWLLTPEVVSEIIPLQTGIFDLVVFDEASQMYAEKGIPSILRAKKVVIAGDHKQLRPSNLGAGRIEMDEDEIPEDAELPVALEEESLLDLARFKYRDVLLNFHYRSKYEELIAFSNYAFYKGRLYVSPNTETPATPPIQVHKMENALWSNRSNYVEAKYIVDMLKQFFVDRTDDETIGIITFNSSQRDLIDDLIDTECATNQSFAASSRAELIRSKDGEDIGMFVKNIESVQGDERDVIIFSIGYAKNENGRLARNFGWLNRRGGENRLNVAITRAKKKVHIVTSFNPSELQVEDTKNDGPRFLKKYLEYSWAISNGDKVSANQLLQSFEDDSHPGQNISFDSDFEVQVYEALTARGYHVDTQVGIGGYYVDLAIKNDKKYVLGIECDGRLYHSSKSARERDYHRQKYLESRGWRIHRIWSTNWWKNPKREIEKICNLVGSFSIFQLQPNKAEQALAHSLYLPKSNN